MKCIHCQKELPDGAKFCKYCGQKQETGQSVSSAAQHKTPPSMPQQERASSAVKNTEQTKPKQESSRKPEMVPPKPAQPPQSAPQREPDLPAASSTAAAPAEHTPPVQAKGSLLPIIWRLAVIVVEAGILAYLCIRLF